MTRLLAELRRRNVIRVAGAYALVGWLLVQVIVSVKTPLHLPDWADTLVIVLVLAGLPIALIFAWAFELTPEGVKRTAQAGAHDAVSPPRTIDYALLGGFVLVLALAAFQLMRAPEPASTAKPSAATTAPGTTQVQPPIGPETATPAPRVPDASIAVLPFEDLSPQRDQEYFSDGMAEEILNVLARIEGLKVASRTSAFQFRTTAAGIPTIAQELGVRYVLEGSVRKSGDAIRVTAQLIDAHADAHLWSDSFDETLDAAKIFGIQDRIADAIVMELRKRIGGAIAESAPASPVRTNAVEAYELFLKARALFQARRELVEVDRLLEEALQIDPKFAEALAIRAAIRQFGGDFGASFGEDRTARREGRDFAARALAIDPHNALALGVTAISKVFDRLEGIGSEDYESIVADFQRALEYDPTNANVLAWQGLTWYIVGDSEKAAGIHRRCIELDPALAACRSSLAIDLLAQGRRDEADKVLDAAFEYGAYAAGSSQLLALAELRRRDAFLLLARNIAPFRGFNRFGALYEALSSPRDENRVIARQIREVFDQNKSPMRIYGLLNALGDYGRPLVTTMHWTELMRPYRQSPEFKQHMRAAGLVDYWHKHGFPPQCHAVGADDFACD